MAKDGLGYSIGKIFSVLFVLTAIEVVWGTQFRDPKWLLWSGLLVCGSIKSVLIFMYFMHMKFERFLLWALILPTPLLVLVFFGYITKDAAYNDNRDYANGMMMNRAGEVVTMEEMMLDISEHGGAEHAEAGGAESHDAGAAEQGAVDAAEHE